MFHFVNNKNRNCPNSIGAPTTMKKKNCMYLLYNLVNNFLLLDANRHC